MTNAEKESLFYDFVKQHQQLQHLTFGEPIENSNGLVFLPMVLRTMMVFIF
jgi:hypothetical protein